ncbi:MAG TPA: purine-nucleoside phosphorylase [Bacteroidota bacterium]|nr:purine-nucleoside phosphorylase [Bacteroidota bacterium]
MSKSSVEIPPFFDKTGLEHSVRYVSGRIPSPVEIALVLGSGLGDYADTLAERITMSAQEIPHYPISSVPGHQGAVVFGTSRNRRVLAFKGRIHLYECNDLAQVLSPVMLAAMLGAHTLIVTNAAGGVDRQLQPGDLMLITDQIDLTLHPMKGFSSPGAKKPTYDKELASQAMEVARRKGLTLRRGVYAGFKGPSYETRAEVEMVYRIGGDAVGMSTVKEVALASRLGMRVLGISCITNAATGIGSSRLAHEDVTRVAERVKKDLASLLDDLILAA